MLPLVGQRIQIRLLRTDDLEDFLAYRSNPEVCRWQGFGPFDETAARQFLRKHMPLDFRGTGQWQQLGVEEIASGRLIGDCAVKFSSEAPRLIKLGLTLAPDFQRQGFGYETMILFLDFLFGEGNIHKAIANIDERNLASVGLISKLGFQQEGRLRKQFWNEAEQCWDDEFVYGMLEEEWKQKGNEQVE